MLCVFCSRCGVFIHCDVQLSVLAACGQSWQRLWYQLDHQVPFNPWDQTQSKVYMLYKTIQISGYFRIICMVLTRTTSIKEKWHIQVSVTICYKIHSWLNTPPLNSPYSSLRCTCPQRQTPSPSGSPLSSPVSYREAERSEQASVTPAVSSSAGLSAACAPAQQEAARDPEGDHRKTDLT